MFNTQTQSGLVYVNKQLIELLTGYNQFCFNGFLQLNELSRELQFERSEKKLNALRFSETEELISSLNVERDEFRTQLQEKVGNWKTYDI